VEEQIKYILSVITLIVDELSKNNDRFMNKFLAMSMANDHIRKGFTEFVNENEDVPDEVVTMMMEINELAKEIFE
jgi:hypothetical protein